MKFLALALLISSTAVFAKTTIVKATADDKVYHGWCMLILTPQIQKDGSVTPPKVLARGEVTVPAGGQQVLTTYKNYDFVVGFMNVQSMNQTVHVVELKAARHGQKAPYAASMVNFTTNEAPSPVLISKGLPELECQDIFK